MSWRKLKRFESSEKRCGDGRMPRVKECLGENGHHASPGDEGDPCQIHPPLTIPTLLSAGVLICIPEAKNRSQRHFLTGVLAFAKVEVPWCSDVTASSTFVRQMYPCGVLRCCIDTDLGLNSTFNMTLFTIYTRGVQSITTS